MVRKIVRVGAVGEVGFEVVRASMAAWSKVARGFDLP